MKKRTLRFLGWTLLILSLALSLSACSSGKKDAPAPTDTPAPAGSARPGGAYSALRNAWLLDSPVYADLNGRCASFMWTVPRDVLSQAALDLTGVSGTADGNRVVYTVRVSASSAYTATGMDAPVLDAAAPAGAEDDTSGDGDMVTDLMGDFVGAGGGEYERASVWRLSEDRSLGTGDISMSLNGLESGSERFAFSVSGGKLYFFDVSENVTLFDDDGGDVSEPTWLITRGYISADSARIMEYTDISDAVPDPESLPSLSLDDPRPGAALLVYEHRHGTVTRDGAVLEEFGVQ